MRPEGGARPYRFFGVAGLEIEYAVVDRGMRPSCLVEPLFRRLAGRPTSEIPCGRAELSNELAAHVLEVKTPTPHIHLEEAERVLFGGIQRILEVLECEFGARLLPTGMHPFMKPADTGLWERAGRKIYRAYAGIFPIRGHGWLNVQSCHVNLPFGSEEETVAMHNAAACLIPYLPALAASSPLVEGRLGEHVDNRLVFYASNQKRIPELSGNVVPEFMHSYRGYRRTVLAPAYRALRRVRGGERLCHEWVNSRGAILRFQRRALELRVLDTQECVRMDVAVAVFVRAVLRLLSDAILRGGLALPSPEMLVRDLREVVRDGGTARVDAGHLSGFGPARGRNPTARDVLLALLERSGDGVARPDRRYLLLVEKRLRQGSLSERIRRKLLRSRGRTDDVARGLYEELAGCLERNEPWDG